jgi:selenide,water dikinase
VLADFRDASDAGVFRLSEDQALVQTVDFFTPILDDPFAYGAVAAANSLSDIYAMGARPITALAIVGFPQKGLDFAILRDISKGGFEKLREAGVVLLGGHSVQDPEIKFGYAITGAVDPRKLVTNRGARPGDVLYLTKPIGTGVLATALKRKKLSQDALAAMTRSLLALNRPASEAMVEVGVSAATDVTGFGLLGHSGEMARAAQVAFEIHARSVPLLPEALALQKRGLVTGGVRTNREYVKDIVEEDGALDRDLLDLLYDPQTSGGLLIAVPATDEEKLRKALSARGGAAARIGRVTGDGQARLRVV